MYVYLTDLEQARTLAKAKGLELQTVVDNHFKILKNVLFIPRGNYYLTDKDSEGKLVSLIRNKLPACLPNFEISIENDKVTLQRRHLSIVFQLRLN